MASTPVTIEGATTMVGYLITPPFTTDDSFTFSFPYISQDNFELELESETLLDTDDYEFISDYLIKFTETGVLKLEGLYGDLDQVSMVVRRRTNHVERLVDFSDNSILTEEELDLQSNQIFYLAQEMYDTTEITGVGVNPVTNALDIGGAELTDVGYPSVESSAATLGALLDNVVTPSYAEGERYRSGRLVFYGSDLYRANVDINSAPAVFVPSDFTLVIDASQLAKIAGMESDIDTNESNISTNESNIATNTGDISTNSGLISGNSFNITANYNAITDLDVRVTTNEGDISANVDDIAANTAGVMSNASDLSDHEGENRDAHTEVGTFSEIGVWASTATNGDRAFATDLDKYYYVVDGGLTEMGSGSGVSSVDTIYSQNFEDSLITDFGTSTATGTFEGTLSLDETDPLNGEVSLKYVQGVGSGSDYFYLGSNVLDGIAVPRKSQSSKVLIKFDTEYDGASGEMVAKFINTTTLTEIPDSEVTIKNGIQSNKLYLTLDDVSKITVRFETVTENDGAVLLIDDVEILVNPDKEISVYASSESKDADLLTYQGFGTVSSQFIEYSREGQYLVLNGFFISGTPTSTEARIYLPEGLQVAEWQKGRVQRGTFLYNQSAVNNGGMLLANAGNDYLTFTSVGVFGESLNTGTASANGDVISINGAAITLDVRVPIKGWSDKEDNVMVSGTKATYAYVEAAGNAGEVISVFTEDIPFIEAVDANGLWDGSGFTANRDMFIDVDGMTSFSATSSAVLYQYIGGVQGKAISVSQAASGEKKINTTVKLNAGQRFSIKSDSGVTLNNNPQTHHLVIKELPNYEDLILASLEESQAATAGTPRRTGRSLNGKPIWELYIEVGSDITVDGTLITTIGSGLTPINAIKYNSVDFTLLNYYNNAGIFVEVAYRPSTGAVTAYMASGGQVTAGTTIKIEYTE